MIFSKNDIAIIVDRISLGYRSIATSRRPSPQRQDGTNIRAPPHVLITTPPHPSSPSPMTNDQNTFKLQKQSVQFTCQYRAF